MKKIILSLYLLALTILSLGCGPTTMKADYLAVNYDPQLIEKVAVAPVLDLRANKEKAIDIDAWVLPYAKNILKGRGYKAETYANRVIIESLQSVPRDALDSMIAKSDLIENDRWVMVLGLIDSYSKLTFGSTGNAEMTAFLVDQDSDEILWKHSAIGQIGQGGLMGMAMKGTMERSAIETATSNILVTLPVKKKIKK